MVSVGRGVRVGVGVTLGRGVSVAVRVRVEEIKIVGIERASPEFSSTTGFGVTTQLIPIIARRSNSSVSSAARRY